MAWEPLTHLRGLGARTACGRMVRPLCQQRQDDLPIAKTRAEVTCETCKKSRWAR